MKRFSIITCQILLCGNVYGHLTQIPKNKSCKWEVKENVNKFQMWLISNFRMVK